MHNRGFTLMEILIALVIIATTVAISVPLYQNYILLSKTANAVETFSVIREQVRVAASTRTQALTCDNLLIHGKDIANPYMELKIVPIAHDPGDAAKGYGAALHVSAALTPHGADGVRVASAFYEAISGTHKNTKLANAVITDSAVSFSILLTEPNDPICIAQSFASLVQGTPTQAKVVTQAPTDLKAAQCDGGMCGFIPGTDPVSQCPDAIPYAFTSIKNDANGNKVFKKGCASAQVCQEQWWVKSDLDICRIYDAAVSYPFPFTCSYCCTSDLCNAGPNPTISHPDEMFKGT